MAGASAKRACRSVSRRRTRITAATANESGGGTKAAPRSPGTVRLRWPASPLAAGPTTVPRTASAACTKSGKPRCKPRSATRASVSVASPSSCATRMRPKAVARLEPGVTGGSACPFERSRIERCVHSGRLVRQTVACPAPSLLQTQETPECFVVEPSLRSSSLRFSFTSVVAVTTLQDRPTAGPRSAPKARRPATGSASTWRRAPTTAARVASSATLRRFARAGAVLFPARRG